VTEELLSERGDVSGPAGKEAQAAICQEVFDAVTKEYIAMTRAMKDPSLRGTVYQQPWIAQAVSA
jgi:hypothetical protein